MTEDLNEIHKIHLEINRLRAEIKPEILKGAQKKYLRKFFRDNRRPIITFLILSLVESLLLISLPVVLKYLVENDYNFFRLHSLFLDITLIFFLVLAYIATSFSLIRLDQNISFKLINQIKKHWLVHFYQTPSAQTSEMSDGTLITKFVYHTQLLKMALERVLLEGARAAIFYLVILLSAFFFSSSTFLWLLLGFPLLCLVFVIFYKIGKYYVSREQTLNTRIVKALVQQAANLEQTQSLGLQIKRYKTIEQLLELDTFFRKRREIWVKFSDRLIFALIILSGASLYLLRDFYPIFSWNSWSEGAIGIILTGFFTKILMQSSHAGLFAPALKTGLVISLPDFATGNAPYPQKPAVDFDQNLVIYGKKVKISKYAKVIANFELTITPHAKTLIQSQGSFGKTTLAKYICGLQQIDSLNVKNEHQRFLAVKWCHDNRSRHFLSTGEAFRESVGEFLLGKPSDEIQQEDLQKIFQKLKSFAQFDFIFQYSEFLAKRFSSSRISQTESVLLQIARSILNTPDLICIDHSIFDLNNPSIKESLKILEEQCPNSTFVYFTGLPEHHNKASFQQVYTITENAIQKN